MTPIATVAEVQQSIQRAKEGAGGYCTNFFPVEARLKSWTERGELFGEFSGRTAFFVRRERGFGHLYFCSADLAQLGRDLAATACIQGEPLSIDLLGQEAALASLLPVFEAAGFQRYNRLQRLARARAAEDNDASPGSSQVAFIGESDVEAAMHLIETEFDRYADQLPQPYELAAAIAARQVYGVKSNGKLGALLYFETQGVTSVLRYWVVAPQYRDQKFGSALIRHYFADQGAVRRFILWVTVNNENALEKYRRYGYTPDGLTDEVLLNKRLQT